MSTIPENATGTEIARADDRFADSELANVGSFADAMNLLSDNGFMPESFSESYGTGFKVLGTNDKKRLVGVNFAVLEWAFNEGENGEFVSAAIVTEPGEKLILNDGSTGIYAQLRNVTASRLGRGATPTQAFKGLLIEGGLRESTYPVKKDGTPLTKEEMRATPELASGKGVTYYLAN